MILEVENLSVRYGSLTALRGVSLGVDEGQIVCVLGPNGAGKSTTLAAIAGGVAIHTGIIRWCNQPISGLMPEAISRLGLSLVPEGRHVFSTLTVEENLLVGTYQRRDRQEVAKDMKRALEIFPRLRERIHQPAGRLSGGEQQMLVICRALLTNARMLMMDEPSLGLAPIIVDQVYEMLLNLRQRNGLTLLINEQSSERILKFADHVYVLRSGELQLSDAAANLQDGKAIMNAYFGFDARPAELAAAGNGGGR
ncbi:MAG: ABC transporter ATP-binding protein [Proteobacteria bacterium]|nr:ABC transporter ATP-binding protein [Pseudomonadota bacterium]